MSLQHTVKSAAVAHQLIERSYTSVDTNTKILALIKPGLDVVSMKQA